MITPNPNFRPDPERGVYVQGLIDQSLIDKLTPQIIRLQAKNRAPITVYIDSRGGNVVSSEFLLQLLNATNQDRDSPCRVITVCTNRASSAAADLLSAGDYAIAYPESTIFYHGVRQAVPDPVTAEFGSVLVESLKISNDQSAMALVRKTEWRFMFRFVMTKSQFPNIRTDLAKPTMTDLDCFLHVISQKLSRRAESVVKRARERHGRYSDLLDGALGGGVQT